MDKLYKIKSLKWEEKERKIWSTWDGLTCTHSFRDSTGEYVISKLSRGWVIICKEPDTLNEAYDNSGDAKKAAEEHNMENALRYLECGG